MMMMHSMAQLYLYLHLLQGSLPSSASHAVEPEEAPALGEVLGEEGSQPS
jgi:hypothetical protein